MGFHLFSEQYPSLVDDYDENALNITLEGMEYVETLDSAIRDNLNENITNSDVITVKLNETLNVRFNTTLDASEGYLIYGPRLSPSRLLELHVVVEGSSEIKEVDQSNYTIDEYNFLFFDYAYYFSGNSALNFTMYIIWEYNLTISPWGLLQSSEGGNLRVTQQEQEISAKFNYIFVLTGKQYDKTISDYITSPSIGEEYAEELLVNLTIYPPDKDLLNDLSLQINADEKNVNDYLNSDNSLTVGDLQANFSTFLLNFTANYTLKFMNPVENSWSIDRLYSQRDIRERIYLPSIISGPEHIIVKNIEIFEKTIKINQYVQYSSLFNREPSSPCKNASVFDWESNPELATSNLQEQLGLSVILPYIIKGEVCPFSIKYHATDDLKITIMDNIGMPLIGATVELYYYEKPYGTYISNDYNQPVASLTTDVNAEIIVTNLPSGQYVIKIYQYGVLQYVTTVNTYEENNLVTSIIHFPSWILIFGFFSLSIFLIGYKLHQKNKKR